MYEMKARIRYSEVGTDGKLMLSALVNYFQDCSTFQSEDLGVGVQHLKEQHGAWLMNFWLIQISRYPELCEEVKIITIPYEFDRFYGKRNFAMLDASGRYLAKANSLWFYFNTERARPMRVPQCEKDAYGTEERLDMNYTEERKLALPEQMEALKPFPVQRVHLDTNGHVNNGQYVRMAEEFLPADDVIRELRVEYRTAAHLGDTIYPRRGTVTDGDGAWTVLALCDADGQPYVTLKVQ